MLEAADGAPRNSLAQFVSKYYHGAIMRVGKARVVSDWARVLL